MMSRSKLLAFILVCVAGGVVAALILAPKPPVALASGTLLAPARALADFSLIDNRGRSFASSNLRGHWSLMFFGYTNCPDYCPATLTILAAVEKQLRAAKTTAPQVIFVSVDAKRDTPEHLDQYVPNFAPDFVALTAPDQPTIEALAKKWGVPVVLQFAADGSYSVDHSTAIFVIDPAGKLAAVLTGPFSVDALRSDFQRIVSART